jgi:hypothetical protein
MRIRLYHDEDIPSSLAQALRNRGVDVVTTQEAGNIGKSDEVQLTFAIQENRAILTHNKKHFITLHNDYLSNNREHRGIIVTDQLPVGALLRRFMKLWFTRSMNEMNNRLEFLSQWKLQ